MADPRPPRPDSGRPARLALVIGGGLGLRVLAALMLQRLLDSRVPTRLCLFPDADVYWALGRAIRQGQPYQVSLWNVPHFALRTPGYPLFLAACQAALGENPLAVRFMQAAFGAGCVWLVYRLMAQVDGGQRPRVPLLAAALVAVEPYIAALAVLVLSEALFVPLMVATLWGVAALWPADAAHAKWRPALAIVTGLAAGTAILVRPSWALWLPLAMAAWLAGSGSAVRGLAARHIVLITVGFTLVMLPWWIRNASVFGRFVPTALWEGPSLYDALSPTATGASDMSFLNDPDLRTLDELTFDRTLHDRAVAFAGEHPGRALELAVIKSARYWSPWPNAESLRSPLAAVASACVMLPLYTLMVLGLWQERRNLRAWVLLASPLLYFWALHAVFVGSVRYRIPGEVPAMGLAAIGLNRLVELFAARREAITD